jgi:hypothetical protein
MGFGQQTIVWRGATFPDTSGGLEGVLILEISRDVAVY